MIEITLEIEENWILKDDEQTKRYTELEEIIINTIKEWKKSYRFRQKVYKRDENGLYYDQKIKYI